MDELVLQEKQGFFSRIADKFFVRQPEDDPGNETQRTVSSGKQLSVRYAPRYSVIIRRQIAMFEDALAAAQGLKQGEQQVLNLTACDPALRQKIVDFMSGVTFAQDATWEEVGDHVYVVIPANAYVEVAPATPRMAAMRN